MPITKKGGKGKGEKGKGNIQRTFYIHGMKPLFLNRSNKKRRFLRHVVRELSSVFI
jgi:hypothetical protein